VLLPEVQGNTARCGAQAGGALPTVRPWIGQAARLARVAKNAVGEFMTEVQAARAEAERLTNRYFDRQNITPDEDEWRKVFREKLDELTDDT